MTAPRSFLWHDYETTGVDSRRDRPTQFAAIRTDADLNEIEPPIDILCRLPDDVLPGAYACVLTGILPQQCQEHGLSEAEFAQVIHSAMMAPGTCSVGFNSLRFDDEMTRNLLYRNLLDPYEREWANGNSRWDIIDMVRTCHAFRPDGINWPTNEDGSPSFKLEEIAQANGLVVDRAHDALSDVRSTIAVARLIRSTQPKLFEHMLSLRDKKVSLGLLQDPERRVLCHVSTAYGPAHRNVGLVLPIGPHPTNKNSMIVADLSVDPDEWIGLDAEALADKLAWKPFDPALPRQRSGVRVIQVNKCPSLFSANLLKDTGDRFSFFDLEAVDARAKRLRNDPQVLARIQNALAINDERRTQPIDAEISIYGGAFTSNADKAKLRQALALAPTGQCPARMGFVDAKFDTLVFRYRARNFPDTLSPEEKRDWDVFCHRRLTTRDDETCHRSLDDFRRDIDEVVSKGLAREDDEMIRSLRQWAVDKQAFVDGLAPAPPRSSPSI